MIKSLLATLLTALIALYLFGAIAAIVVILAMGIICYKGIEG